MRAFSSGGLLLFVLLAASLPARAADPEACADLKTFPRLEGCIITECAAKQHDTFETGEGKTTIEAATNSISYSCPTGDSHVLERDFNAQLLKSGYQKLLEDKTDSSTALTARKGSRWLRWEANLDDGAASYSLTLADTAAEKAKDDRPKDDKSREDKSKTQACGRPSALVSLQQCDVMECESKSEDSVALRTAQAAKTAMTGNVLAFTLSCPAIGPAQAFSAVEGELKTSGYEIVFSDQEHPENGWLTGRAGKRWVELASEADAGSISYSLTIVPSGEVLTPPAETSATVAAESTSLEHATSESSAPAPESKQAESVTTGETSRSMPAQTGVSETYQAIFTPPKPVLEVPIDATPERVQSVRGDVVITILVDVDEQGAVTKAVLGGRITKDVLKLQSAALESVSHWRFEPARQDGRIVACVKIPVQIHFQGRPAHLLDFLANQ